MRSQVSTIDDPIILEWFHDLVYQLVPNSQLQSTDLELIVIDSPELNAFAVPGGVVGINFGLLLYSDDEDQLSSVLASIMLVNMPVMALASKPEATRVFMPRRSASRSKSRL